MNDFISFFTWFFKKLVVIIKSWVLYICCEYEKLTFVFPYRMTKCMWEDPTPQLTSSLPIIYYKMTKCMGEGPTLQLTSSQPITYYRMTKCIKEDPTPQLTSYQPITYYIMTKCMGEDPR